MRRVLILLALLCPALSRAQLPNVLVCGAPPSTFATSSLQDVQSKLMATGQFTAVDVMDVGLTTPTVAQLQAYKAVLVFPDAGYQDYIAIGNNLAAYVDGGGGVVTATFNNAGFMGGAFNSATYNVTTTGNNTSGVQMGMGTVNLPSHPIMQGVTTFNGGTSSFHNNNCTLLPASVLIAQWTDGNYLVAGRSGVGPRSVNRADLNFYPPSSTSRTNLWTASTDGAKIMANALRWVATSIQTGAVTATPLYPGTSFSLPFTASGTYNSGNVFTAQLSDAAGSFAAPVSIGTLTGIASGNISVTLPQNAVPGTGYRIRVVGSNPAIIGADNGTNLTIQLPPNALAFDGSDDYVSLGSSATLRPTGALTLAAWAYKASWTASATDQGIAGNTEGGGYELFYSGTTGQVTSWVRRNGAYSTIGIATASLSAGWHHFAMTYDGRNHRFYVDGSMVTSNDAGASYAIEYNSANAFIIGAEAGTGATPFGQYFAGAIDEVSIWSRALCAAELQNSMNGMLNTPASQSGLLAYYGFNQGIAGGNNTGISTLADAGPNGLTGTLTNILRTGTTSNFITSTVGTTTAPVFVAPPSAGNNSSVQTIAGATYFSTYCNAIATIAPAGAAPVAGSVTTRVWVDAALPSFNGQPYVQRRYDIAPAANAANATATVTLYYTQAEFNAYNAAANTPYDLPTGPNDAAGKANLRITQHHGSSATGLPGSFTGWTGSGPARIAIDPADANIVWNAAASRWEVTFDVTGFSGFFVHGGANLAPLPVKLVSFTAEKAPGSGNRLSWTVAAETGSVRYRAERSADGRNFSAIGSVNGAGRSTYTFTDAQPLSGSNYYRLSVLEADGSSSLSSIVLVRGEALAGGFVQVSPVPAASTVHIACSDASVLGQPAAIIDMQGRTLQQFVLGASQEIDVRSWPAGVYSLKLSTGEVIRIVRQ